MSEAEFAAVYREKYDLLCDYLERKFPRFDRAACEDLAQLAATETLEQIRQSDFRPETDWWSWLRWLASKRALDYLRERERIAFERVATAQGDSSRPGREPADLPAAPSQVLAEAERRGRQMTMLSDILQEYCRECEARPERLKQKEIYERALRGQKPAEIAAAMGMARGTVDVHLKRARDWVLQRARQADVHRSVFLTLHRRKPEK